MGARERLLDAQFAQPARHSRNHRLIATMRTTTTTTTSTLLIRWFLRQSARGATVEASPPTDRSDTTNETENGATKRKPTNEHEQKKLIKKLTNRLGRARSARHRQSTIECAKPPTL